MPKENSLFATTLLEMEKVEFTKTYWSNKISLDYLGKNFERFGIEDPKFKKDLVSMTSKRFCQSVIRRVKFSLPKK